MGKIEPNKNANIVEVTCSTCHRNIIYLKVQDYESNTSPYKSNQITCTECNQGLMLNLTPVQ
ncbi:hypothetical protein [Marinicella litoralis]|uniref:Uncharacterized protein n=1 Tax=Marinicella litoralis TaxID=644220 RepID=A0A4R6XAJ5_9GAMM|nr:hypothetical protein [Marinicella litoralis]TDR14650.1 hypothetical protein C8D91_2921 [Marinicella litoralis]